MTTDAQRISDADSMEATLADQIMSERRKQEPGALPPGLGLDSLLTVEEFAVWTGLSVATVMDKVRRKSIPVVGTHQPRRINPRTYLASRCPSKLRGTFVA